MYCVHCCPRIGQKYEMLTHNLGFIIPVMYIPSHVGNTSTAHLDSRIPAVVFRSAAVGVVASDMDASCTGSSHGTNTLIDRHRMMKSFKQLKR